MAVPNLSRMQVSRLAGVARVVRLIRDQEALGPWMIETVDQPLQVRNSRPYHLRRSMQRALECRMAHQIQHQQWGQSIRRGVMVG